MEETLIADRQTVKNVKVIKDNTVIILEKLVAMEARSINQADTLSKYLSIKEAAKYFNVSLATIHNWKKKGYLKFSRAGGRVYIKESDCASIIKEIRIRGR